jgi:hypothetical protein
MRCELCYKVKETPAGKIRIAFKKFTVKEAEKFVENHPEFISAWLRRFDGWDYVFVKTLK